MRFNRLLLALLPCALWAQIGGSFLSGDLVRGGSALTTPGLVPTVSALGTLGQSDITIASGVLTRAGTLGLSATGITFAINGSETGRWTTGGNLVAGSTIGLARLSSVAASLAAVPTLGTSTGAQFALLGDGAAYGSIHGVLTSGQSFIQAGRTDATATAYSLILQPVGGNVLVGTTTDDGASKLQVLGNVLFNETGAADRYLSINSINTQSKGVHLYSNATAHDWTMASVATSRDFRISPDANLSTSALTITKGTLNHLFGGSTDGNYRLDVQSSGSAGTLRVYDRTATTGVTSAVIRAGAGQSTTALTTWQNNAGTSIAQVLSTGEYWGSALSALGTAGSENAIAIRKNAAISATNIGYYFAHRDTDTDLWLYRFNGTTYKNLLKFTYNGGTDQVQIASDTGMRLGFFGATPVAQQVAGAGDAAAIITALKNLGLMAP